MQYKIITTGTAGSLSTEITKMLSNGWILQGGVSVGKDEYGRCCFAQAMVKSI